MPTILFAFACIELYDFQSVTTIKAIVVDASLTDEQKAHYARITYTREIDSKEKLPVTGASVWIEDNVGECTEMIETEPGYYLTDKSFSGEIGKFYVLYITTSDGRQYASNPEEMLASPPINSLYGEYIELPSTENETFLRGIQFFIDTQESLKAKHYRYEFIESYELRVPIPSKYILTSGDLVPQKREPPIGSCYKTHPSTELLIHTTSGQTANIVNHFPIRFVSDQDKQLVFQYSLIVKQYAINPEAYEYYQSLKENNEFSGSLFDKQKGSTYGNIHSLDDSSIPVLGYFEVAGVSEKKRIFSQEEFAEDGLNLDKWICSPEDRLNFLFGIKVLYERDKIIWG